MNYKYAFSFVNSINKNQSSSCYYTGVVLGGVTASSHITQRKCLLDNYKMQSMIILVYVSGNDVEIFVGDTEVARTKTELPHVARGGVTAGPDAAVEILKYDISNKVAGGGMQN